MAGVEAKGGGRGENRRVNASSFILSFPFESLPRRID